MTSGKISYRRRPDISGFLPSLFPLPTRGLKGVLGGPVAHHFAVEAFGASIVHEVLEVGERLGEGEA